jgi:hypothetical protein
LVDFLAGALAVLLLLSAGGAVGQELTPRSYWPAPKGTKVAFVGYAHSTGDTLLDPSVPLYGINSKLDGAVLGYLQTVSLFDRSANLLIELPYADGKTEGFIESTPATGNYSGLGDIALTVSVNLMGAPSMTPQAFRELRASPRPILGASVKVVAPTGDYDSDRLLNVGSNRWAVRPEIGYILPLRPQLLLEVHGGVWFFGDDDEFVAGSKKQDPVYAAQLHLVRRFSPGLWASLDLNYYTGGRQTIGGKRLGDVQRNARLGFTLVAPFAGRHAIKIGYAGGVVTEFGTDYDQFLIAYQVLLD